MSNTFEAGAEFAGYRIVRVIGSGGFATVYLAEDLRPAMRRKVALKVLHEQLAADDAFRDRFLRESLLAVELDHHPNIVPVHDAGEDAGHFYIAMRFIDGIDLKEKLSHGPLDPTEAVSVIAQVGSALDLAHQSGLVHRDVKPGNVLLPGGSTDHVYLADFGLTKETASEQSLTQVGQFLGTLYYAAPEQIEGKDLDGRSDQYALGCMLYECLTGEPPFKGEMQAIIGAHLTKAPPKVSAAVPGIPTAIDEVVARAMAKNPADRFDSCGELGARAMQALREPSPDATFVTGSLPGVPITSPPAPPPDPTATIVGQTSPGIPLTPAPGVPATPPPVPASAAVPPPPPPPSTHPGIPTTTPPAAPSPAGAGSGLNAKVGGVPVWAMAGGGVALLLMIIVGIFVVSSSGSDSPPATTAATTAVTTADGTTPDATTATTTPVFTVPGGDAGSAGAPLLDQTTLDGIENQCASAVTPDEFLQCDFLFFEAAPGSAQQDFGGSCGDTIPGANGACGTTVVSGSNINGLINACGTGTNAACDELFFTTPVGSKLELFGNLCGGRSTTNEAGSCETDLG